MIDEETKELVKKLATRVEGMMARDEAVKLPIASESFSCDLSTGSLVNFLRSLSYQIDRLEEKMRSKSGDMPLEDIHISIESGYNNVEFYLTGYRKESLLEAARRENAEEQARIRARKDRAEAKRKKEHKEKQLFEQLSKKYGPKEAK